MNERAEFTGHRIRAGALVLIAGLLLIGISVRAWASGATPPGPSGEAVYIREQLDAAQSGPTYSDAQTMSPNRTTPRYDALVYQLVPGGAPVDVADCRLFPELGARLGQVAIDATGRYVAVTSYIPLGRVIHRGPALFVYDIDKKSLAKVTDCVQRSFFWSPTGSRLLISDDFGSGAHFDIYDAARRKTAALFPAAWNAPDTSWANGGRSVVYTDPKSNAVEVNLRTGRKTVRWRNSSVLSACANSPEYTASPYSESAIGGGDAGDKIVAYGLPKTHKRLAKIDVWNLDYTDNDFLWSPDGKMLALRRFYWGLSDPSDNGSLPTSTNQEIEILDCGDWKKLESAVSWTDEVAGPYRYHLVGWSGGHRWLVLLSDGVYKAPGITAERLIAFDTHLEKFRTILQIDSWVWSIDWHADD